MMKRIIPLVVFFSVLAIPVYSQTQFYIYEKSGSYNLGTWLRYNRCDGFFPGLRGQFFLDDEESFWIKGRAGYGFSLHAPRYQAEIEKRFPSGDNEYLFKIEGYRLTATGDAAVIPDWQNSMSALLFRLDYYDFYETFGAGLWIGKDWKGVFRLSLTGGINRYGSLPNKTRQSLLDWGGEKKDDKRVFRDNPPVAEGDDYYVGMQMELDTRPSPSAFVNGWFGTAIYTNSEFLKPLAHGDYSYHHITFRLSRLQAVTLRQRLLWSGSFGIHHGTVRGRANGQPAVTEPFLFDLGGLSTLRGYRYKEFINGSGMAMTNLDYYFNGSFLPRTFLAKIWGLKFLFKKIDLMFFGDAGTIWNAKATDALPDAILQERFRFKSIRCDAGWGLHIGNWMKFQMAFPLTQTPQTGKYDYKYYLYITPTI